MVRRVSRRAMRWAPWECRGGSCAFYLVRCGCGLGGTIRIMWEADVPSSDVRTATP